MDPERFELLERADRGDRVRHDHRLGDFELQLSRIDSRRRDRALHDLDQSRMRELPCRDVHAHPDRIIRDDFRIPVREPLR